MDARWTDKYNYRPDPGKMFITPGGKPALTVSSANFSAVIGVTLPIDDVMSAEITLWTRD